MTILEILKKILSRFNFGKPKYLGLRGRGQEWESVAERHLKKAGYVVRARNVRSKVGEIDLIAEEKGVLCFIEVKGRRGLGFGQPAEAVTMEKQRRIFRTAEAYVQSERLGDRICRFDVVSILGDEDDVDPEIEIFRDAFRGPLPPHPRR